MIHAKWIEKRQPYTGAELRSHFIYEQFGLLGDSMVAFRGTCEVKEHMVDLEDVRHAAWIYSEDMLHFLVEHFDSDLEKAVLRQHLLVGLLQEVLNPLLKKPVVVRRGDDLFVGNKKLSVSIATRSPVSTLIHLGLNISSRGTPVPTIGLSDLKIRPQPLARQSLKRYAEECEEIQLACVKVRPTL